MWSSNLELRDQESHAPLLSQPGASGLFLTSSAEASARVGEVNFQYCSYKDDP